MNQIQKLTEKINLIEIEAASMDESSDTYYRDLYAILTDAYFAAKDIIQLMQDNAPLEVDNSLELHLKDAENTVNSLTLEVATLKQEVARITSEYVTLLEEMTKVLTKHTEK